MQDEMIKNNTLDVNKKDGYKDDMIIELKDLKKIYPSGNEELIILDNVNLSINQGESVIIEGESGNGKSTLLNLIGGLDLPSKGSIISCGYAIDKMSEKALSSYRNQSIGFIFQFHYLLKDFSARENVMLPAFMSGIKRAHALEKADALLDDVGLAQRKDHFPSQLSGGERQRIALARALINDPDLILADEPTGNLDEKNSELIEELLFSLVNRFNKTLLLATHDNRFDTRGNRRLRIAEGRVIEL